MKRKITFFASFLLLLGMAVVPNTSTAQKSCDGGGCLSRYNLCREAAGEDQNPDEFSQDICLSEYNSCVANCNARGKKN